MAILRTNWVPSKDDALSIKYPFSLLQSSIPLWPWARNDAPFGYSRTVYNTHVIAIYGGFSNGTIYILFLSTFSSVVDGSLDPELKTFNKECGVGMSTIIFEVQVKSAYWISASLLYTDAITLSIYEVLKYDMIWVIWYSNK